MIKTSTNHKLLLAILFTILLNLSAKSQIRNALSFDGIDDKQDCKKQFGVCTSLDHDYFVLD